MKRLEILLTIALSIAMITGCGKAGSGNNTGQSAEGSTGQAATESGEKEEELSVGKSGGALQEGINSLYGIGGAELDVAHAREFFTKAAEGGDARAHTYLARIHRIDANNSLAVEEYQKAIELGDDLAKVDLGYMYLGDQGVKIDTHKAMDLFEEAWESGCAEAVFGIGLLYEDDRFEVSMNKEKAIQYFEIASQSDDPYTAALAYQELAEVYNSGEDADIDKALENLEKANAIQKHWTGDSLRAEGDMLSEAGRKSEAEECYKKAAETYELNAEKGMPCLWCQAGYIYLKCLDPDQNKEKAFECLNKAAEAGIALGWSYTGFAYSAGAGVEKDINKAVEYFTKAAEAGEANAQTALGTLYIDGEEVEADLQLGKEYIEAAVNQGSTKALVAKIGYMSKSEPELFDSDPMMVIEMMFDAYNSDDREVRHLLDEALQQMEDEIGICLKPWKLTDKKNSGKLEGDWQVYGQGLKAAENENMLSALMMEGYSALFAKGTKVSFGENGNMQIGPLGGKYSPAGEHQIDISDQENKLRVEWGYARFDSDVLLLNFDFSGGSGLQVQLKTPEKIEEENRRKEAEAAAWEAKNSEEDGTDQESNDEKSEEPAVDEEYSGEITGKQLQRNPDEYIGQKVKFTGDCFMVSENNGVTLIGINTEDERVLVQGEISSDQLEQRVLESDVEKGIQYLKDAANAGEFLGLSTIGAMYYYGDLVEQDYDKAMEYFRKAVENGESHGDALNFIGLMYENGDGVETDYQIAFEYYEKAAKLGHEIAKKNIRKLVDNGHISREEAAEWVD